MKIYEYPKCTTCKKAKKYIEDNKECEIEYINIKENTPTKEELIDPYLSIEKIIKY